jgi:hypothetical protein
MAFRGSGFLVFQDLDWFFLDLDGFQDLVYLVFQDFETFIPFDITKMQQGFSP